jgi:D-3-phosphoglycerate dehydrogenase
MITAGRRETQLHQRSNDERNAAMRDPVEPLIVDLLEWIGAGPRPYPELLEVWRTSCPRLPVWEEANGRGFVDHHHEPGQAATVSLSALGHAHLKASRARHAS